MPAYVRDWTVRSGVRQTAVAIQDGKLPLEVKAQLLDALRGGGLRGSLLAEDLVERTAASLEPHVSLGFLEEEAATEVLKGAITMLMSRRGLLQGLVGGTIKVRAEERRGAADLAEALQDVRDRRVLSQRLSRKLEVPLVVIRAITGSLSDTVPREVPPGALDFALSSGRAAEAEEHLVSLVVGRLGGKFVTPEQTRPAVLLTVRGWLEFVQRRLQREDELARERWERSQPWLLRQAGRLGYTSSVLGDRLLGGSGNASGGLRLVLQSASAGAGALPALGGGARASGAGARGGAGGEGAAAAEGAGGGAGGGGGREGGGSGREPPGEPPGGAPPGGAGDARAGPGPPGPWSWPRPALAALLAAAALLLAAAALRRRRRLAAGEEPAPGGGRAAVEASSSALYMGISVAILAEVLRLLLLHRSAILHFLRRLLGIGDGLETEGVLDLYPEVVLGAPPDGGGCGRVHMPREAPVLLGVLGGCAVALVLWRRRRTAAYRASLEVTPFEFLAELRPWLLACGLPRESSKTLAATALFAHSLASQTAVATLGRMSRSCTLVVCSQECLSRVAAIQQESCSTITRYDVPRLTIWQLCDWQRLQDCLAHDGECLLLRPNGSLHAILQQSGEQTVDTWRDCAARAGAAAVLLEAPGSEEGARVVVLCGDGSWNSQRIFARPPSPRLAGGSHQRPPAHMMVAAALHSVEEFVVASG